MDDTDFDALCEGATPAEAKQLRKLLADWCHGAENSFPVQLVLLTRAQWRAAATVPLSVEQARKLLNSEFVEQRQQANAFLKGFEQTAASRSGELKAIVQQQAANVDRTLAEMRRLLTEADKTATRIHQELETGAEQWQAAQRDLDQSARQLRQECADLKGRPWHSHWVLVIALIIAAFVIGYFLRLNPSISGGVP